MIETLRDAIQGALKEVETNDVEIIGEALQRAVGQRQFALIADYLGAGDQDDDGGTGWMQPDEFEQKHSEEDMKGHFGVGKREPARVH